MSPSPGTRAAAILLAAWLCGCSGQTLETTRQDREAEAEAGRTADDRALRGPFPEQPVDEMQVYRPIPDPGRWREYRTHRFDADLTDEQREGIEKLESIGYVSGSRRAMTADGVSRYDMLRAYQGYNFYVSGHAPEAILMDMEGALLHRWRMDFRSLWPDYPVSDSNPATQYWRRAYLFENGDILALFDYLGIVKLDPSSNLVWANPIRSHHDLEVMPDGDIYVLTAEARLIPQVNESEPVQEDFVVVLGPDGREKKRISVLKSFENSFTGDVWQKTLGSSGDVYHTNSLDVLDGRIAHVVPEFKRGNLLVYLLNVKTIAVIDPELERVVWVRTAGTERLGRHDPKILPNGHMMLFHNFGPGSESRVIEIDLGLNSTRWEYSGGREDPFYSSSCGTAQRLPNGNTLVTESDNGRAFEVTPDKQVVWQFISPHRAGPEEEFIATLFDLVRIPPDFPLEWADAGRADPD